MTFWHCECIALVSEAVFTERYRKWCKRKGYHFSGTIAAELYIGSIGHITTLPKNSNTKLIITTAAKELASAKSTLAVLRAEMDRLARQLPEYDTVRAMYGVALQRLAEAAADSALVGLGRVGSADQAAELGHGILMLDHADIHRTRGHEVDQFVEEGLALVHGIEALGLIAAEIGKTQSDDAEPALDDCVDDLAGIACGYGVGFDDCECTIGHNLLFVYIA